MDRISFGVGGQAYIWGAGAVALAPWRSTLSSSQSSASASADGPGAQEQDRATINTDCYADTDTCPGENEGGYGQERQVNRKASLNMHNAIYEIALVITCSYKLYSGAQQPYFPIFGSCRSIWIFSTNPVKSGTNQTNQRRDRSIIQITKRWSSSCPASGGLGTKLAGQHFYCAYSLHATNNTSSRTHDYWRGRKRIKHAGKNGGTASSRTLEDGWYDSYLYNSIWLLRISIEYYRSLAVRLLHEKTRAIQWFVNHQADRTEPKVNIMDECACLKREWDGWQQYSETQMAIWQNKP